MKQVFPDIRPRRLGTRGNSRYCYAALRKTTRLSAPQLALDIGKNHQPNMTPPSGVTDHASDGCDSSQQHAHIVRQWAASVLDMEFATTRELADYIAGNQLLKKAVVATTATPATTPTGGASRVARVMQPKVTAAATSRMKPPPTSVHNTPASSVIRPASATTAAQSDTSSPSGAKKRRRKRRNSHASDDTSPVVAATANGPSYSGVKTSPVSAPGSSESSPRVAATTAAAGAAADILVIKREPNSGSSGGQQQMAYNYSLNNPPDSRPHSATTATATATTAVHVYKTEQLSDIEADAMSALSPTGAAVSSPVSMPDDDDPIQPHPLCKKVRQAQQTKGLLSMRQFAVNNHAQQQQQQQQQNHSRAAVPADTLMRPPDYSPPARSQQHSSEHCGAVAKRLALLQQYRASNGVGCGEKEDDVTTDIIIPRERVISICSLDKDALDDYLNGGDNSQDQEVELLRYFQTDETSGSGSNNTVPMETTTSTATSTSASSTSSVMRQQVPVLENYHLSSESTSTTPSNATVSPAANKRPATAGYEKNISELRWYLQQNLQLPLDATHAADNAAVAAAVTAAHSQMKRNEIGAGSNHRHPTQMKRDVDVNTPGPSNIQPHCGQQYSNSNVCNNNKFTQSSPATENVAMQPNTSSSSYTQSPTTVRRRNYSFVPISPGPESPLSTISASSSSASTAATQHTFFPGTNTPIQSTSAPPAQQQHHPFLSPQNALHRRTNPTQQQHHQHHQQQPFKPNDTISGGDYARPSHHISASSTLSAPTSPSALLMVRQQQQHFGANNNHATFHTQLMPLELTSNASSIAQSTVVANLDTTILTSFANRSQSAPLHRHMPTNHQQPSAHNKSYGSSLTETPIDFGDFGVAATERSNSIPDQQHVLIKCEPMVGSTDVDMKLAVSPLLQHHHRQQHQQQTHLNHQFAQRDPISMSASRSVPSTPQPSLYGNQLHMAGSSNSSVAAHFGGVAGSTSMYADMSKSVPTTPTGLSRAAAMLSDTPFRYSPLELMNRDFLINGNTVAEPANRQLMLSNTFFDATCQDQQQRTPSGADEDDNDKNVDAAAAAVEEAERRLATAIGDINDELSRFGDESGADPIVGSDLLHTL